MSTRLVDNLDDPGDLGIAARASMNKVMEGTKGIPTPAGNLTSGMHHHQVYQLIAVANGRGHPGGDAGAHPFWPHITWVGVSRG